MQGTTSEARWPNVALELEWWSAQNIFVCFNVEEQQEDYKPHCAELH